MPRGGGGRGPGYTTEPVRGLVEALRPAAALRLIGGAGADNPASARLPRKGGVPTRADTDVYTILLPGR